MWRRWIEGRRTMKMSFRDIFKPGAGARAFFTSILVWGVGVGCFQATMNNFLSEVYDMDGINRGILEFFREFPGLMLVFLLALLHKMSDWKIMRLGTFVSMVGAALLLIPFERCAVGKMVVTLIIMLWSTGEHLVLPVRSTIAIQVAKPEHAGRSLGLLTGSHNFGMVAGSLIVMGIFFVGGRAFGSSDMALFNTVWVLIVCLMAVSVVSTFSRNAPNIPSKRPRFYFDRKFSKFYALELFYGARKQIFLTFAPYVIIREYGFPTAKMALLFGICAAVNIFAAPQIGKLCDKWGYRNVMIWDTVVLFFVCLLYGFAGDLFPAGIALAVVCVNFLFDAVISTTAMATSIYVRDLAKTPDEITATLSTGLSINHLISIMVAPLGGWVWMRFGVEWLFAFAAAMAVCNTIFAMTIPKPPPRPAK